jgi:hypothetical protein
MKLALFVILTLLPLGWLTKDMPSEYELMVEYSTLATWPSTTTTTTTTTEAPRTAPLVDVTTTTGTPGLPVADGAKCPQWWDTARSMGWPEESLPTLDRVMWNESRCLAEAVSPTRDYGLTQINWATWSHMVRDLGYNREALLVPAVNLLIARIVYQVAEDAGYRCGFSPWYMSGDYCG